MNFDENGYNIFKDYPEGFNLNENNHFFNESMSENSEQFHCEDNSFLQNGIS